jgi:histidinol-phosphate/aromatic aminotransferase/cobyric acid decarboxylase-like protein
MRGYNLPNSARVTFGLLEENEIFFKALEAVLAQPVEMPSTT